MKKGERKLRIYIPKEDYDTVYRLYVELCIREYVTRKGWDFVLDAPIPLDVLIERVPLPESLVKKVVENVPKKYIYKFIYQCIEMMGTFVKRRYKVIEKGKYLQRKDSRIKRAEQVFLLYAEGASIEVISEKTGMSKYSICEALGRRRKFYLSYKIPYDRIRQFISDKTFLPDENDQAYRETLCLYAGMHLKNRSLDKVHPRTFSILWYYAQGLRVSEISKRVRCTRAYVYMVLNKYPEKRECDTEAVWIGEILEEDSPQTEDEIDRWVDYINEKYELATTSRSVAKVLAEEGNYKVYTSRDIQRKKAEERRLNMKRQKYFNHFHALWLYAQRMDKKELAARLGCSDAGLRYIIKVNEPHGENRIVPPITGLLRDCIERKMLSEEPYTLRGVQFWLKESTGINYNDCGIWDILVAMGYKYRSVRERSKIILVKKEDNADQN